MTHSSDVHPSPTRSEFLDLLQNEWTFRVACQKECDPLSACNCLRHIVHVEALKEWWMQPASETPEKTKLQSILDELGPAEGELGPFDKKVLLGQFPCLTVFSLLLKQGHGHLLVGFRAAGVHDRTFENETKDSDPRLRIELEKLSTCSDVDRVLEDFQKERWAYCPLKLEMNMDIHLQNTRIIPPFCRKIKLGEKGGTALIYWVTVQKNLISDESLECAIEESLYTDKVYGDCYQMVLKSYHGKHQSAYDLEKKAFSGLKHNDSVPIVGYLGCYTHEYGEGTNAGKAYNLLLEYGERDLYEHWEDEKNVPPVRAKEIIRFWQSLFEVADAIKHMHNLEVQRGREEVLRYNGWHADIKPDNILLVRGRMKLADFGFSRFSPAMSTPGGSVPTGLLEGFTDTYGAPEVSMKSPNGTLSGVTQSIDIWSFGCVLSVAATWIVLGFQGIRQYGILRQLAPANKVNGRIYDRFHDGIDVLPEIKKWHDFLRGHLRPSDTATIKVLDLVECKMLQMAPRDRISTDDLCNELALLLKSATEGISHLETNSKDTDGAVLRALLNVEEVAQVQKSSEKSSHPLQQRIDVTGDTTPLDPPERASVQFRKEENRKSRRLGQTLYRREILQSELGYATSNIVKKSELSIKGDHGGATTESPLQEDSLSSFHTSSSISNGESAESGGFGIRQGTNRNRRPISPYTLPGLPIRMNGMSQSQEGALHQHEIHGRRLDLRHARENHATGSPTSTSRPGHQYHAVHSELSHYATHPSSSHNRRSPAIEDISGPSSAPSSQPPPQNYFQGVTQAAGHSQIESSQASYRGSAQQSYRNVDYENSRNYTSRTVPLLQTPVRNLQAGGARHTRPNPVESVHEMPLVSSPEIKVTEHPGSDAVSPHQITPPGGLRISEALTQFDHEQYAHGLTAGVQPIRSSVYDLPYDICHQRQHLEHGTRKGVFAKFKTKLGREDRKPDSDLAKTFDASRDLVLVIDNGASMFHHWSIVTFVAETLAKKAAGLDKDGIDVYFTVAGDEYNQKDLVGESGRQQLRTALSNATPDHVDREGCQTDMCDAFSKISHNWKEKGKPATTLLVLTDGIWKETNNFLFDQAVIKVAEDPIAATTKQTGKRLFSIQFIRFGEEGYERLRSLDDDLCKRHSGRDIVDHCSWRTSTTKMYKGSIEGYHDLDDADEQDMNYHYTELVGLFKRYNESNNAAESSAHLSPQSPTPSSLKRSWSRSSTSSDREKHQSAPTTLLRKNSSNRRPFSQ